jgi:hypothetical protein
MKKWIFMIGSCIAAMSALNSAFAAQPKKSVAHPAAASSPISGATTSQNFHMPPSALQREMQQLERAEHLLEMSSHDDRHGHEAIAARHLQAAVNELKLEAIKNDQAKRKGQVAEAAPAATPAVRK